MEHPPRTVEIHSVESQGSVILLPVELSLEQFPSVALRVEIIEGEFRGANPRVWVTESALAEFARQLQHLDRNRTGEASLHSMSPGEFDLVISSVDGVGHLLVSATVGHTRLAGSAPVRIRDSAEVEFELDPSRLSAAVESFRALFSELS